MLKFSSEIETRVDSLRQLEELIKSSSDTKN